VESMMVAGMAWLGGEVASLGGSAGQCLPGQCV